MAQQIPEREQQALLAQPTATVAAALRRDLPALAGVELRPAAREWLAGQLADATGSRTWTLEHLRERRTLGEFLDVARLVSAQRRLHTAA